VHPTDLVQAQLDAYNDRDLDRFLAAYADEVRLYRPPVEAPALIGKPALAAFYRPRRFNVPGVRADLVPRQTSGHLVVDHERIPGLAADPIEALLVFRVIGGLITEVWVYHPTS